MLKQFIVIALIVPLALSACSSPSDSNPLSVPEASETAASAATESASPQANSGTSDACAVLDQMQLSLSTAVTDLIVNPDLVTAFQTEFDNQVTLLNDLVESLQGDSPEQQRLQADLDAAVKAKEDAETIFNAAQQEKDVFAKTLGVANAALSARDAVTAAERVLINLSGQLQCTL